jgi:hypothetical protein
MASRHATKQARLVFKLAAASGAYKYTFYSKHVPRCDVTESCTQDPQPVQIEAASVKLPVSPADAAPVQAAESLLAKEQTSTEEDAAAQRSRWSIAQARRGTLAFVEKIHDFNMPATVEEVSASKHNHFLTSSTHSTLHSLALRAVKSDTKLCFLVFSMLQFARGQAAAALAIGEPLSLAFYNTVLAKLANLGAWQSSAAVLEFMRVCMDAVLCILRCN